MLSRVDWVVFVVSVLSFAASLHTVLRGYSLQIEALETELRRTRYDPQNCRLRREEAVLAAELAKDGGR